MNATAELGPRLWGNLQCATKFTVLVPPHVSQGYAQSSLRTEEGPSLHASSPVCSVLYPLMDCRVSTVVTRT